MIFLMKGQEELPQPAHAPIAEEPMPEEAEVTLVAAKPPRRPKRTNTTIRNGLIVDKKTKLSDEDMHRRINRIRDAAKHRVQAATSSEDEAEETSEVRKRRIATAESHFIDELFLNVRQGNLLKTRFDYLLPDLLKIPSGSMSRRLQPVNIPVAIRTDLRSRLIARSMRTTRQPDHTHFYLIPGQQQEPVAVEQPVQLELPEDRMGQVGEQVSIRDRLSGMQSFAESTDKRAGKRQSARVSTAQEFVSMHTPSEMRQSDQMALFMPESMDVEPRQLQYDETMLEQPLHATEPIEIPVESQVPEIKEPTGLYEKIVLDGVSAAKDKNEVAVLQTIIKEAAMTQKCAQSSKPKRAMAARLFAATLSK
jgi:hypothetical protein